MPTFVTVRPDIAVEVTGADRLTFLDAVASQQLRDRPGRTVVSAMELDAHGAPVSVFDVVVLEDRVLLLAPTVEVAHDLVGRLGTRTFLSDAAFRSDPSTVVSLRGAGSQRLAEAAGLDVPVGRVEPRVGATVVHHRHGGVDVVVAPDEAEQVVEQVVAAGAERGDAATWDAWHVAAGIPRWGHEIAAPHLPEELGLLPTHVHLGKGCYPGQEAVARMWMLGRPRRRLARVEVVQEPVEAGWSAGEGRRAVTVTSVVDWDGQRVGLAFVPADVARGDQVAGDAGAVRVLEVVGEGETVPGHDPAVLRRRDRRGA